MGYGIDGWNSILGRGMDFFLLHSVQTGYGAQPASSPRGTEKSFTTHFHIVSKSRMVKLY
jgi:hypothetical protein